MMSLSTTNLLAPMESLQSRFQVWFPHLTLQLDGAVSQMRFTVQQLRIHAFERRRLLRSSSATAPRMRMCVNAGVRYLDSLIRQLLARTAVHGSCGVAVCTTRRLLWWQNAVAVGHWRRLGQAGIASQGSAGRVCLSTRRLGIELTLGQHWLQ